jgi:thiamine biosynthesis protein ThiS
VSLRVIINGEEKQVSEGATVADLITALDLKAEQVAVELNRRVVRRAEWNSTKLAEGDKVEVVHFVGGGAL